MRKRSWALNHQWCNRYFRILNPGDQCSLGLRIGRFHEKAGGRCVLGFLLISVTVTLFFQARNRLGDAGRGHSNVPRYLGHR